MNSFIRKLVYSIGQKIFGRLFERYHKSPNPTQESPLDPQFTENQKTIDRINYANHRAFLLLIEAFSIKRLLISSLIVDYLILLINRQYLPELSSELLINITNILGYSLIGIGVFILFKAYSQNIINKALSPKSIFILITSTLIFFTLMKFIWTDTHVSWLRVAIEILVTIFAIIPLLHAIKKAQKNPYRPDYTAIILLTYFLAPLIIVRVIHLGFFSLYLYQDKGLLSFLVISFISIILIMATKIGKEN